MISTALSAGTPTGRDSDISQAIAKVRGAFRTIDLVITEHLAQDDLNGAAGLLEEALMDLDGTGEAFDTSNVSASPVDAVS